MTESDRPTARTGIPWPLVVIAVVLVAGLAFAIGRFTTFDDLSDATGSGGGPNAADAGFARDMQVHHAQAVEMAMIEYRATDDDELRALAYDIATAQAAQRGEMYGWLVAWGLPQAGDPLMSWMSGTGHDHGASATASAEELEAAMGMATAEEIDRLASLEGSALDCLFLELMIRHHAGAIEMTDAVVELGSDERVIQTARSMGQGQTAEIAAMQSIQTRLGCTG
ncbi:MULTISPECIES: DUF305 domain-containing protein [unclassified Microbacterium]|uniref:DUF305 domain-containing protein n=1 Tax=Microbacterium TaxID=33882 RepID=UPI003B9E747B